MVESVPHAGVRARLLTEAYTSGRRGWGEDPLSRLRARVPSHLSELLEAIARGSLSALTPVPLDQAEEFLLILDDFFAQGSGHLIERIGYDHFSRVLSQTTGAVVVGDLIATLLRLRPSLEGPFVGVPVGFSVHESEWGWEVQLWVEGQPRSARILRYFGLGMVKAAQRFCRGASAVGVKFFTEVRGDHAIIEGKIRHVYASAAEEQPTERQAPRSQRPPPMMISSKVDAILERAHQRPSSPHAAARPSRPPPSSEGRVGSAPPSVNTAPPKSASTPDLARFGREERHSNAGFERRSVPPMSPRRGDNLTHLEEATERQPFPTPSVPPVRPHVALREPAPSSSRSPGAYPTGPNQPPLGSANAREWNPAVPSPSQRGLQADPLAAARMHRPALSPERPRKPTLPGTPTALRSSRPVTPPPAPESPSEERWLRRPGLQLSAPGIPSDLLEQVELEQLAAAKQKNRKGES